MPILAWEERFGIWHGANTTQPIPGSEPPIYRTTAEVYPYLGKFAVSVIVVAGQRAKWVMGFDTLASAQAYAERVTEQAQDNWADLDVTC